MQQINKTWRQKRDDEILTRQIFTILKWVTVVLWVGFIVLWCWSASVGRI